MQDLPTISTLAHPYRSSWVSQMHPSLPMVEPVADSTDERLEKLGLKTIHEYLRSAPTPRPATKNPVPNSSVDAPAAPAEASIVKAKMLEDLPIETPFYVKMKGKGKGRPVPYDRSRSSVAQIFGEPLPFLLQMAFLYKRDAHARRKGVFP